MHVLSLSNLIGPSTQVLLVNAPAVDTRLPWARWQQPVGLLQIGAALRARQCDVRLIDCLTPSPDGRWERTRVGQLQIEGYTVNLWRFGLSPSKVLSRMRTWLRGGWRPDAILVSCAMTTWWQGAQELIKTLKAGSLADVPILLGGAYATFYPEHAAAHTAADQICVGAVREAADAIPDLSLTLTGTSYSPGRLPRFAGIYLLRPCGPTNLMLSLDSSAQARPPQEVAAEVAGKAALGVTEFAFFDDWLGPQHREPLAEALQSIAALGLRNVRFVAIGNISPRLVDIPLVRLLRRAGFRQVFLHDDVAHTGAGLIHLSTEGDYRACVQALAQAGFRPRTDEIGASVLVGIPGEDISAVAERLIRLASIVGSVHLVPFQYTPGTPESTAYNGLLTKRNGRLDPTALNGRFFPLARLAGASFEEYMELTRLAALLNSKYHSRTFDFLGDGLVARLVQHSLRHRLWDPFTLTGTSPAARTSADTLTGTSFPKSAVVTLERGRGCGVSKQE